MDGVQYDLFLACMGDYELTKHAEVVQTAQRLLRHQGAAGDDYSAELAAIEAEQDRRRRERLDPPF